MVNRKQANVARLKVLIDLAAYREWSQYAYSRHPEWPLRMIAIHNWRCSAGGSSTINARSGRIPAPRRYPGTGRTRRFADIAGCGLGRLNWADSGPSSCV
jgi:hypothetical protein